MPRRYSKTSYSTVSGDAWDRIAKTVVGDETLMHRLMAANPAHRQTVFFPGGVELTVPAITITKRSIPRWKRRR